jgi:hypothetical protein
MFLVNRTELHQKMEPIMAILAKLDVSDRGKFHIVLNVNHLCCVYNINNAGILSQHKTLLFNNQLHILATVSSHHKADPKIPLFNFSCIHITYIMYFIYHICEVQDLRPVLQLYDFLHFRFLGSV